MAKNQGEDHLHGGPGGFHQVYWEMGGVKKTSEAQSVTLKYTSPDKEEGYPGELKVELTYSLTAQNELKIDYLAKTTKSTIVNLTHHSFFNLKDGARETP